MFHGIRSIVETLRGVRNWPESVFLPSAVIARCIAQSGAPTGSFKSDGEMRQTSGIFTLYATWRVTQGIYRFDPDIYEELRTTPIAGELPVELLLHLPQWCVYLETPGMQCLHDGTGPQRDQLGVWVWLDWWDESKRHVLGIVMMTRQGPALPLYLPLIGTLKESMTGLMKEAGFLDQTMTPRSTGRISAGVAWLEPVLSLLLYLCLDTPEVWGDGGRPSNPEPRPTKRGDRLFPADKPTEWPVGVRMGDALRLARKQTAGGGRSEEDSTRTVRPHFRGAHWAHRWTGPLSGERKLALRWIHPALVNVDKLDELPAVIRPVKRQSGGTG